MLSRPEDCHSKACQQNLLELKRQSKNLLRHVERLEALLLGKAETTSDELELVKRLHTEYMALGATPNLSNVKQLSQRLDKEWGGIDLDEDFDTAGGHDDMDVDEDEPAPSTHHPVPQLPPNLPPDAPSTQNPPLDVLFPQHSSSNTRSPKNPSPEHTGSQSPQPPAAVSRQQSPADASSPISVTGLGDSD